MKQPRVWISWKAASFVFLIFTWLLFQPLPISYAASAINRIHQQASWTLAGSANAQGDNALMGVSASSLDNGWAVGSSISNSVLQTLIERRHDASSWQIVASPNIPGLSNELVSVSVSSESDVWAVGDTETTDGSETFQTLIEHWDGSTWSIVPGANTDSSSRFASVAITSTNDVWAVGSFVSDTIHTLIEHWDGTSWSTMVSPSPGQSAVLTSIAPISANDVWAVGSYQNASNVAQTLIEHWDGTTWTVVTSPDMGTAVNNTLNGVTAISTDNVWAAGSSGTGRSQTLAEHWNGSTWSVVPSANVPGKTSGVLNAITSTPAGDVWAVGLSGTDTSSQTLIEHWNGIALSTVSSPDVHSATNNVLAGISFAGKQMLAVGFANSMQNTNLTRQTLAEEYT